MAPIRSKVVERFFSIPLFDFDTSSLTLDSNFTSSALDQPFVFTGLYWIAIRLLPIELSSPSATSSSIGPFRRLWIIASSQPNHRQPVTARTNRYIRSLFSVDSSNLLESAQELATTASHSSHSIEFADLHPLRFDLVRDLSGPYPRVLQGSWSSRFYISLSS